MMAIKQAEVKRDENGMFTHPDFPLWDEGTHISIIDKWLKDNDGSYSTDSLECSADEDVVIDWFENGSCDCSKWEPKCNKVGAFILSIHDTDDGPVAIFFCPNKF